MLVNETLYKKLTREKIDQFVASLATPDVTGETASGTERRTLNPEP
jgi:hypothetical protein